MPRVTDEIKSDNTEQQLLADLNPVLAVFYRRSDKPHSNVGRAWLESDLLGRLQDKKLNYKLASLWTDGRTFKGAAAGLRSTGKTGVQKRTIRPVSQLITGLVWKQTGFEHQYPN